MTGGADGGALERFLDPISPATFFAEYWERRTLHLPGPPGKFAALGFGSAAHWSLVDALPDDARCLRAIYHDQKGQHQELLELRPALARSLWDAGMTIVFNHLEDYHAGVQGFIHALRGRLDLPGQLTCACFYSPRNHGAKLHYDNHSAIVLQLEGKKRWRFSREPALEFPPKNYGYESDDVLRARGEESPLLATRLPDRSEFLEVDLEPGHLLYLPPGTWHEPREIGGGGSLAITLGPFPKTSIQLVQEQLARGLGERLEWRRSVPVAPTAGPTVGLPPAVASFLERRLEELKAYVNGITPADLARLWHSQVAVPRPPGGSRSGASGRGFGPRDRVLVDRSRRVSRLRARDGQGDEKLYLYLDGEEIDFPGTAEVFLATLLSRESFVAEDARKWVADSEEPYDWEDVKAILEVLGSRGFLERES